MNDVARSGSKSAIGARAVARIGSIAGASLVLIAAACGGGDSEASMPSDAETVDASRPDTSSTSPGQPRDDDEPAPTSPSPKPTDAGSDATTQVRPRRFLCINGAGVDGPGGRESGGNPWFEQLCAKLGSGLVQACSGNTCFSSFAFETTGNPSRDALVTALDTNKDGRVTAADTAVDLVLLGYSWGGTNVRDLAAWMTSEARFDGDRRGVASMLVIDPYRPLATMDVPANVARFVEFRHSVAPENDCSRIQIGGVTISGPYLGLVPRCKATSDCTDYDYTLGGKTFYPSASSPGLGWTGAKVDHCAVVDVAAAAIPTLLAGTAFSPLPPKVPVAAY